MTAQQLRDLGADREARISNVLKEFSERNTARNRADYLEATTSTPDVTIPAEAVSPQTPTKPARRSWFSK
jgi:hypothetical protein